MFAPIIFFLLPAKDLQPNTSIKDKLKQNDFLGIVFWTGWNIAFAMAINFGGIRLRLELPERDCALDNGRRSHGRLYIDTKIPSLCDSKEQAVSLASSDKLEACQLAMADIRRRGYRSGRFMPLHRLRK